MKPRGKFYRLNYFIQARELRLLDETGKQIGVVSKEEALKRGREAGKDVVEIAPHAQPPVAKLIDFKKFKYLEAKKDREEKKKQKHVGIKEVRLSPFIGEHDLDVRVAQAKDFLKDGNQVKIALAFRGRQITRREFGYEVLNKFLSKVVDAKIVRTAHFEGKILVAMIAPDKKSSKSGGIYENADQKNSGQTVQHHQTGENPEATPKHAASAAAQVAPATAATDARRDS